MTTRLSDNQETIRGIISDPTIPLEAKNKIVEKLWMADMQGVQEVHKKNQKLFQELESNSWKISLVNTVIWTLAGIFLAFVIYLLFKFRRLLGSPI